MTPHPRRTKVESRIKDLGARLAKHQGLSRQLTTGRIAVARATYEREGPGRTNRRYGYVTRATS